MELRALMDWLVPAEALTWLDLDSYRPPAPPGMVWYWWPRTRAVTDPLRRERGELLEMYGDRYQLGVFPPPIPEALRAP